ncbi:hypothetical protein BDW02DRAFT_346865 [Decorospora gaudefroyi]|uniref:Cyclin N-terminal domain-containing protein n=1 Tax=Decorospora gaudefroyi TaxID=184978 RepID=A0A6A5KII8_9PLEO|nr:hypothetical protein BDW02DRAFT_346865 [Decorospora gaudefroyi]
MVRPTTETGTCLILLEQDTEMFLANISNVILHWPLNTLDALFRQPSRIAVEGLPRPHASLSDTSRRLVQILKYWVHGAPDVIPLALFLLLRLRRSWENGGASTWCIDSIDPKYVGPIWLSAAMVASYKFLGEDDQSPQANASWAAYLRMGRKVLNDAELSLLQGIGWGVWVQARELEAWKDMLEWRGLPRIGMSGRRMGSFGVKQMPRGQGGKSEGRVEKSIGVSGM